MEIVKKMTLTMQEGVEIPLIGIGTWQATDENELEAALDAAINIGYRHIDTASRYENEQIIGRVLKKWFLSGKLRREDVFITTKLDFTKMHPDLVEGALKCSLEKLQLDYVDLYLIHFPIFMTGDLKNLVPQPTDHLGIWRKMEDQIYNNRARSIGISNWNINHIERIMKNGRIKPANVQIELHVYYQQKELFDYCRKNDIIVVSYSSLGTPGSQEFFKKMNKNVVLPNILQDPVLSKIAKKHNKTTAQIALRFLIQNDIVVIPKSVNPERIKENFEIFDFKLDYSDIQMLEDLDKGDNGRIFRMNFHSKIANNPENPFMDEKFSK